MLKIDTHQHYWRYRAEEFPWIDADMPALRQDCLPARVAANLDAAQVTGVIAVQARTRPDETSFLLDLAQRHPKILAVVGWMDLTDAAAPEHIARWRGHAQLKGLRHILQDEPDVAQWVAHPRINAALAAAQHAELVYDVLVFESQLSAALQLCTRHDLHWLVLDHVGKPALRDAGHATLPSTSWRRAIDALAALPHVMCKLSGLVTETAWRANGGLHANDPDRIMACFDHALEAFGAARLMYGSDWPVCQLAAPYDVVYGLAARWSASRLSDAEQAAFWSGNAMRCYGIEPSSSVAQPR